MANLATAIGVSGTKKFHIHAPLITLSKKEIIEKGLALGVDYSQTHSCYDPIIKNGKTYSCGLCDSCKIRLEGFAAAGARDEVNYV